MTTQDQAILIGAYRRICRRRSSSLFSVSRLVAQRTITAERLDDWNNTPANVWIHDHRQRYAGALMEA
jgi:hypothetical protein